MRKILTTLLITLFIAQLSAQNNDFEKELYIGFGGGALTSSIDFQPNKPQLLNMGIHAGVSAKYITEKNLGLLVELNYAQKGWAEEFETEPDYRYSRTLHYLELPFMTHIYFGNKVRFVINAGPQVGFLFGDNSSMSDSFKKYLSSAIEASPNDPSVAQYTAELRRFDYGITGGIGMEFKSGIGNFQLEGRYYFGLGDIFESRKSKNSVFNRSANRNIVGKLTYFFPLF